ncbi:MAG: (5-formylfuran-3-yl)methyl phosphate synthase [Euryarchaeota archaeon]|uniref:(5-formylfuran-3-yl)methyl phosphate synthase n=1 Tax=Methanobacterium sp. MZD130B TaxID=3394378 RepID=UPI001772961A|nr:(5-formylfuran-3-yl)methyl phosphate synthase [Euryarchaeota archaeon]HHT19153.1 (5-formylfuran-3-yl)methyl phosphate synthase [Methanobacterium sp.]
MLLLISPINTQEAREAINGGADIIDVKNPKEGSLGANFPWVIKNIREITPKNMQVSATLGDVPYKPGTVSLAAAGAVVSGADYIKVGLYGTKNYSEALEVMENVVKTANLYNSDAIVVASGYADAHRVGAIDPMEIPKVAADSGSDLAMVDTAVKDGKTLFDYMDQDAISQFTGQAHDYGLKSALAGSVTQEQLPLLAELGCDVAGIRGAACIGGDRNSGSIHHEAVARLKQMVESF